MIKLSVEMSINGKCHFANNCFYQYYFGEMCAPVETQWQIVHLHKMNEVQNEEGYTVISTLIPSVISATTYCYLHTAKTVNVVHTVTSLF